VEINLKYEKYIPIIGMAFMLLLVQLIAVALSNPLNDNDFKAFEDPKDTSNVIVWVAIILIFTGFIFLVIKLNKKWMIQAFILISVGWTLYYIFYALFSVFLPPGINLALTIILSVGLTVLLYKLI
jgi:presenilin-like A22 family membrane protease